MPESLRRQFHDRLEDLQAKLIEMAGEAEALLGRSTTALLTRDQALAAKIREADERIDRLEVMIDEEALELLALQQPLARDLRQIAATLKIANDLERVGDHAVKISRATLRLLHHPPIADVPQLEEMVVSVRRMVADALRAYTTRDSTLARGIPIRDEQVDELRDTLHRILVGRMLEDPSRVTPGLQLILISQSLERAADLATNIAEETVFLVEGTVIRHEAGVPQQATATTGSGAVTT
jgi:phosphate transport system protein